MDNEKLVKDRLLLDLECALGITSVFYLLIYVILGITININSWEGLLILLIGIIQFVINMAYCIKIEQIAGYYRCEHCNHHYIPVFSSVLWAPHLGRTRYMECPECHKKSWQKKVLRLKFTELGGDDTDG